MSVLYTSLDAALLRRIEPGISLPLKRLQAMRRLVAPLLPGIADSEALLAAAQHDAQFFLAGTLHDAVLGVFRQQGFANAGPTVRHIAWSPDTTFLPFGFALKKPPH